MAQGAETTVAQCSPTVEWADYAAVQAKCGSLSGNEITRNSATVVPAR